MTNEEALELDQECIAEEEAGGKDIEREEKEQLSRKFTVKGLAEAFADLSKLLRKFENVDPTPASFH